MKTIKRSLGGTVLLLLVCSSANAALISRLSGQAYYDDVLNITWVADANLSQTSGFDADGLMNWNDAQTWIGSLNTASYLGVSDWRLPSADVNTDNTLIDCSTATEPNCRDNEMGYMYWRNGVRTSSPSPFTNLQSITLYWSGTVLPPPNTSRGYAFYFFNGNQGAYPRDTTSFYAWAVRSGDVTQVVPVPAAVWLLGSALGVLGWIRRKAAIPA